MSELFHIRKEYHQKVLTEEMLHEHPVEQFRTWFTEVLHSKIDEPNAMILATCGKDYRPSARIVLLKQYGNSGFTFFTNYKSQKGRNIAENPFASAVFSWLPLERQVRIEGIVKKVPELISDAYFKERPIESRISAWVSAQSSEIPSREYLEELQGKYKDQFNRKIIPRPSSWGGYRLIPDRFEFWQGRENRLHDRFEYTLDNQVWKIRRLAP
jgi:pyridoxamine 5'-phosphate oxidase